jgi:hypothetical protein
LTIIRPLGLTATPGRTVSLGDPTAPTTSSLDSHGGGIT